VTTWFFRASGIPDQKNRVDHYPGRYEAESMKLEGYTVRDVTPAEDASGGKAISCPVTQCAATLKYDGAAGWYTLHVEYFDQMDGVSHYRLLIDGQPIDEWAAAEHLPTRTLDSSSSTRRLISGIALRPGDEIRIEGKPDGRETAALDYIEIVPSK
jgi:alpha-glucuronidase